MTTVERRLDGLTRDLTPRERAILVMQHWLRGEEWDTVLNTRIPEEQRAEYDCIVHAIEKSNNSLHWGLVFEQRFLFETEIRLGWLQALAPAIERCKLVEKALRAKVVRVREGQPGRKRGGSDAVLVPAMPVVELGWGLADPLWGVSVGEDFSAGRWSGDDLVASLLRSVQQDLVYRSQMLVAYETVAREMTAAFDGFNAVHKDVEHALDVCRRLLHRLHAEAQKFGALELLPPTDEQLEQRRAWADLDEIRGTPQTTGQSGQQWESDYARKQREEQNEKWRDELEAARAGRDGELGDTSVFVTGAEV